MSGVKTFIAGGAQRSHRDTSKVDHPAMMMVRAVREALADAGIKDISLVDGLACVEPFSWTYKDLGLYIAEELGLNRSVEHVWVPAGGTSPQDLLHKIGTKIDAGEIDCAVICGAESMRTRRRAAKTDHSLDWPDQTHGADPMRGQRPFSSELERIHGLARPIQLFPLIENALRSAYGRSQGEQIQVASNLLAKNAQIAKDNPHAWFRDAPSAEDIAKVTPQNRMIVYPYTKRMNAIMDVDQSAAVVVVSRGFMGQHGLAERSAAVLGGAGAEEVWNPIERANLASCPAMDLAIHKVLERAGLSSDQLDAMDLYSCFPSAIQLGLQALHMGVDDPRPFSLTGGLAFAGGPGNAYVLHSLVAGLDKVREQSDARLLVTGIGMANTKHSATVLTGANHIPPEATGILRYREEMEEQSVKINHTPSGWAHIHTYTIEYDREGRPTHIILLLDLEDGVRTIANMRAPDAAETALLSEDPIGRRGHVEHDGDTNRNFFSFE